MFAQGKHYDKRVVPQWLNDTAATVSHNRNMAGKRWNREEHYEAYRAASGWYLAAWRDFRKLTLDDLAAAIGTSKGHVSDLETGASRPDRPIRRFNRDTVDSMARALGTTGGRLIDMNPFTVDEATDQFATVFGELDPLQKRAVLELATTLSGTKKIGT